MNYSKRMLAALLAGMMTASMLPMSALAAEQIVLNETAGETESTPVAVDGYYYATINMQNADFYYGELNGVTASDSTEVGTEDKVAAYRAEGMYDTVTSATTQKSTRYATAWYETEVANDETNGEATGVNLYGIKDVQIKVPVTVYDAIMAAQAEDGSTLAIVQDYLKNAAYSSTAFMTEYKQLNADGTFTAMVSDEGTTTVETDAALSTNTVWGDYQIDLGQNIKDYATTDNLYGIVVTDKNGNNYGMLHSDNTWLQTQEFSWAVDDVFSVHGENHVPYQRSNGLNGGNTISKITYLLKGAPDVVVETDTYIKNRVDSTGSVIESKTTTNGTTVKLALENVPEDANYTVTSVVKGARHGTAVDPANYSYDEETGVLTLSADCAGGDDYVVTMTDDKYSDIKISGVAVEKYIAADSSIRKAKGSKTFALNATTNVADAVLKYTSSNTKIAKVDENGKVTVSKKSLGKAVITIAAEVTTTDRQGNTTTTVEATKDVTVKVNPKNSKVSSLKSTKAGCATVKVAKVSGAKYQIQYSTSKSKIASGKKVSTSSTTKTLKSLKKGKNVYVRVRAYQKVKGTTYYSDWSAVKSVKVKK